MAETNGRRRARAISSVISVIDDRRTAAAGFVRRLANKGRGVELLGRAYVTRALGNEAHVYRSLHRNRTALDGLILLSTLGEFARPEERAPRTFGALHAIDEALAVPGWKGLGMHPHADTEVLTLVLSGDLKHEEGTGRVRKISAYELQVLSSGVGVDHNESNASGDRPLEFFQILLHADEEKVPARVDKLRLPIGKGAGLVTLALGSEVLPEDNAALRLRQRRSRISLVEVHAGEVVRYTRAPFAGNGLFVFVLEGEIDVEGAHVLGRRDGLALPPGLGGLRRERSVAIGGRANACFALIFDVPHEDSPMFGEEASEALVEARPGERVSEDPHPADVRAAAESAAQLRDAILRAPRPGRRAVVAPEVDVRVSDYIAEFLVARGVRLVFGVAGSSVLPLIEAIRQRDPKISWVLMRHEGAAALAASAVAKLTGGVGAVVASSGPGATNAITGLVDADRDRASIFCLTGKIPRALQHRTPYQDIDNAAIIGAAVRRSVEVTHEEQLPGVLRGAAADLRCDPGVVHVAISTDLLARGVPGVPRPVAPGHFSPRALPSTPPSPTAIAEVARLLDRIERLVIAVGPNARATESAGLIEELALRTGAAIITQLDAKGVVDELHDHAFGALGVFGYPANRSAFEALREATGVLLVGVTDARYFLQDKNGAQRDGLIVVKIASPNAPSNDGFDADARIEGALEEVLEGLLSAYPKASTRALSPRLVALKAEQARTVRAALDVNTGGDLHPGAVFLTLSSTLSAHEESVVAVDVGSLTVWASQYLLLTRRETFLTSRDLATMGFALPACIGAALTVGAEGERVVVGVVGDGSMQMTLAELGSAVQSGAGFVLIVLNNGELGAIAQQQPNDERRHGTLLHNPDFVAVAKAYGAEAERVSTLRDLESALERALRTKLRVPYVIEVPVDARQPMPLFAG